MSGDVALLSRQAVVHTHYDRRAADEQHAPAMSLAAYVSRLWNNGDSRSGNNAEAF